MSDATTPFDSRPQRMLYYTALFFLFLELSAQCFLNLGILGRGARLSTDLFLWIAASLFLVPTLLRRRLAWSRCGMEWGALAFLGLMALSVFLPSTQHKLPAVLLSLHWATALLLFFVCVQAFARAVNPRVVIVGLAGAALILAAFGVAQRHIILPQLLEGVESGRVQLPATMAAHMEESMERLRAMQPSGMFVSPNDLGGLLAMAAPLMLMLLLREIGARRIAGMAVNGVALAVVGYCLLLTDSKGGIVAGAAGCGLALAGWRLRSVKVATGLWVSALLLGILLSLLVAMQPQDNFRANARTMKADTVAEKALRSMLIRFQYWQVGGRIFMDHPVSGVGLTNYSGHFSKYRIPEGEETQLAHNNYIEWLVSFGLLGCIPVALLAWPFFRRLLSVSSAVPQEEYGTSLDVRRFLLGAGLFALAAGGFALNSFEFGVLDGQTQDTWQLAFLGGACLAWAGFCHVNWRALTGSREADALFFGVLGGVAAFSVHGLVDYGANIVPLVQYAAVLAAALMAWRGLPFLHSARPSFVRSLAAMLPVLLATAWIGSQGVPVLIALDEGTQYADAEPGIGARGFARTVLDSDNAFIEMDERAQKFVARYFVTDWLKAEQAGDWELADPLFLQVNRAYAKVSAANPLNSETAHELGRLHEERFRRLLERRGNREQAMQWASLAEDSLLRSIAYYNQACGLYPALPAYHVSLGHALDATQDREGARAAFEAALALSPRQFRSRLQLPADQVAELRNRVAQLAEGD